MTDLKKLKDLIYKNLDMIFANLGIEAEQRGDNLYCNCPIHSDSDNPTGFSYNTEKNLWKCWTNNCHEEYNRDIFGLICGVLSKQSGEKVSFGHCVSWAKKILNLDDKEINNVEVLKSAPVDNITSIMNKFNEEVEVPKDSIGKDWPCDVPSEYFKTKRNYSTEVLKEFEVGDCQDRSSSMRFRSVIPIYNDDGTQRVGSIGRSYLDYIEPKFWIEPGLDKKNYLYGLDKAKERSIQTSTLFLVEGQGDVWRLWECGVRNAVGLFGKEIYEPQVNKINKLGITNLVILLDHDQPGREAKTKIKRYFDRLFRLIFPPIRTRKDIGQMAPKDIDEKILKNLKGLY